jgi:hypothetical protein
MRVVAFAAALIVFSIACQAVLSQAGLMLGGPKEVAIDGDVTRAGEFAVNQLNTKQNVPGTPLSLVKVVSAKRQVVAGTVSTGDRRNSFGLAWTSGPP